ncbi:MAG TPA: CcdB family protein [Amaricoccus sp.]|nr:CcdB family protein [Amaricoccus sp.]
MGHLKRFDVAEYRGVAMVVVESDLLPPDPAVVVIPLLPDYPAVRYLNPEILHADRRFVLATRLIGSVFRSRLRHTGSVAGHADEITRAMDVLTGGI